MVNIRHCANPEIASFHLSAVLLLCQSSTCSRCLISSILLTCKSQHMHARAAV